MSATVVATEISIAARRARIEADKDAGRSQCQSIDEPEDAVRRRFAAAERERNRGSGHFHVLEVLGAAWNFDGHFVTSESLSPTNVPPFIVPLTMISRPPRNGSGTSPL